MEKVKNKKKTIVALILAVVLLAAILVGVLLFIRKDDEKEPLVFDYALGSVVQKRVNEAQYLPDTAKLASTNSARAYLANGYISDLTFDIDDYRGIVDELGIITGTATRRDTSILDIKEEIYTVLNMVPSFGRWFRLPEYFEPETAQDGYNNFYYKLDYDKSSEKISITRMSSDYACTIYDSGKDRLYSTYYYEDVAQYQVMQVNYYYNADNKEVVQCSVVDFARLNKTFYPIQSQYLENIEDTSTTKIQTVVRKELTVYLDKVDDDGNVGRALDIDTNVDGGVMRKMVQLNYTDSDNVELIKIEQNNATNYYSSPNATQMAYYLKQANDAIYYTDCWHHYDEENSVDHMGLVNGFSITQPFTKERIIERLKQSEYTTRQVMGKINTSSAIVCTNCYNRINESGLMVYKCNHNKNKEEVTANKVQYFTTSEPYDNVVSNLISYNIQNHLNRFAKNVGVSQSVIDTYSNAVCVDRDTDLQFETALDQYLNAIAKNYLEEVSFAKDVKTLYNTVRKEYKQLKLSELNTSAIASVVELKDLTESVTVADNVITVSATASVLKSILLENGAKYSLSLVLFNEAYNTTYALVTNYLTYNNEDLALTLSGTYNLNDFKIDSKDVALNRNLKLTLGLALTKDGTINDIVCSGLTAASVSSATSTQFENQVGGFDCTYIPSVSSNKFVVEVSALDVTGPTITIKGLTDTTLSLLSNAKVLDLLALISVSDNDVVKSIQITHGDVEYTSYVASIVSGTHKIVVLDRSNNQTELEFTIELV